jgi:cell division protein FtsI/penicillin-binding protein 2
MVYSFEQNHLLYGVPQVRSQYMIGGKTGTAQIANPNGGYYPNDYNGTLIGFVGGDRPQYIVIARVNDPKIAGYAGARAAGPIFVNLSNMLIDSFGVTPKTH